MKKLVFFLVGVCLAVGSAILVTPPTSTEACGFRMPVSLLDLYKRSDSIYIGRYSGTESGGSISEDERHTVNQLNKYFDISQTLKGIPAKTFTQTDSDYMAKDQNEGYETLEQVEAASIIPDVHLQDEEESNELKPGDVVLLFVRSNHEEKTLELTDYLDGIKKLPPDDLRVYEARIKELNAIFATDEPDTEAITDWLVRCAQERATRWEGAYQLRMSFYALDARDRREAKRKADQMTHKTEDEHDDDEDDEEGDDSDDEVTGSTAHLYAELLNEHHKQTLASVLLNSEFQTIPQASDRAILVHGDRELISLISRWADTRLTELFMSRLRGGAYTSSENTELMETISTILADQLLADLAEKYSDIDHKVDDDAVEDSDLEESEEENAEEDEPAEAAPDASQVLDDTSETVANVEGDQEAVDENAADENETADTVNKPVLTYKQFRQNLIEKFLARAETLIADPSERIVKDVKE